MPTADKTDLAPRADSKTLRFVQVSDIHFGQERNGTIVFQEDVRSMLIKDAASLAADRGPADLVLVVGDISYSGKKEEYRRAGEWLDQLTTAVGCDDTDVWVVPGNHDCDWTQSSRLADTLHRSIRGGSPASAYAELEDLVKHPDAANPLLPKLNDYCEFASGYGSNWKSAAKPFWTHCVELGSGARLQFVDKRPSV